MNVKIPYGDDHIVLRPDERTAKWHILQSKSENVLTNPQRDFLAALRAPIASRPLHEIVRPNDRVVIVTSDGTRPVPNKFLISLLIEELNISDDRITILLGNGTHRPNSKPELLNMFGEDICRRIQIINHNSRDDGENRVVGNYGTNGEILLNRNYIEADKRIVLGFIEPHFFAGFSGGAKGVIPGVAGLNTIMHVHRTELIEDPRSTWGEVELNPIRREITEMVSFCPPDFLVNVTLDAKKMITGFYCGDYVQAFLRGCEIVRKRSMIFVKRRFPLVVTSNGGYPLDQNLYQTVKGISAAARIVETGGTILVASECRDGIPIHGMFAKIMSQGSTIDEIIGHMRNMEESVVDQWQVQILAAILRKASIGLFSSLGPDDIRSCCMYPVHDIQCEIDSKTTLGGGKMEAAILLEGPLSIPTVINKN